MTSIRLAPRLVARTEPIGRGVSLALDEASPAAARACAREAAMALARIGDDAPVFEREAALFETVWRHLVSAIVDCDGVSHPPDLEARDGLFSAAPELAARARDVLDAHYRLALAAVAEGNASGPSRGGVSPAASSTAATAPTPPGAADAAARASAAPSPAPKTSTH